MKSAQALTALTYTAVIAVVAWIFLTDPQGDLHAEAPDILDAPIPQHAPRTVTAHDGTECHLWPLEREYATTDPVFFWLCPDAGPQGADRWGIAWDFRDVNAEVK